MHQTEALLPFFFFLSYSFAAATLVIITVLMGAPVLIYLGYATNDQGRPIIDYRELFSPSKIVSSLARNENKSARPWFANGAAS